NLRIVLAIARKDIVDAARNMYLAGAIAMPVGFYLLFQLILPSGADLKLGPIAVYDQGSSRLVAALAADPLITKLVTAESVGELEDTVREDAVGGLALPAGFDAAVAAGSTPELTVLLNGKRGGGELNTFRRLVDEQVRKMEGRPPVAKMIVRDVQATAGAPQSGADAMQTYTFLLLLVMGLAMTGCFIVPTLLVEEKEKSTLKTILVSPATYADVVAGKALVGLFYAVLGAALLLVLYRAGPGNLALLLGAIFLGSLVMVEIGLLMGSAFKNTAQVNSWSSIVLVVLLLPSFVSGPALSVAVATAMKLLPTYYLVQLVEQARNGSSELDPWISAAVLGACAVVCFFGIVWFLRREEA
ncbi:MAG: ABC transporter permease, partial [Chloroflexota bacterium]